MTEIKTEDVAGLIRQFFEKEEPGQDAFGRNMELEKRLQKFGAVTTDLILEELFSRKATGEKSFLGHSSPLWFLLCTVKEFAESRHASRVAEILFWEELLVGQNRSLRCLVPEILEKIGDSTTVSFLEAFAEKVKQAKYTDEDDPPFSIPAAEYYRWDQEEIAKAIATCKARD